MYCSWSTCTFVIACLIFVWYISTVLTQKSSFFVKSIIEEGEKGDQIDGPPESYDAVCYLANDVSMVYSCTAFPALVMIL